MTEAIDRIVGPVAEQFAEGMLDPTDKYLLRQRLLALCESFTDDELPPAPSPTQIDGGQSFLICPHCHEETDFQMVEATLVWYKDCSPSPVGDGSWVFDAGHREVSDEGTPLWLECKSCFTKFAVPEYDWR